MKGAKDIRVTLNNDGPVEITVSRGDLVLNSVVRRERVLRFDGDVSIAGVLADAALAPTEAQQVFAQVKGVSAADTVFVIAPGDILADEWHAFVRMVRSETDKARDEGRRFRCILIRGAGVALASEAAGVLSREEIIGLHEAIDVAAVTAGIDDPQECGNAVLEEFGRRAIEAAVRRMGESQ